jgi:hypothetical protein
MRPISKICPEAGSGHLFAQNLSGPLDFGLDFLQQARKKKALASTGGKVEKL